MTCSVFLPLFCFKRNEELFHGFIPQVPEADFRETPTCFSVTMGCSKGCLHRKMVLFSGYFCVFLSNLMQTLTWVFTKIFMRYYSPEAINSSGSSNFSHENHLTEAGALYPESFEDTELKSEGFGARSDAVSIESDQIDYNGCQPEPEPVKECSETVNDIGNLGLEEEETTELVFKFQYQSWNCNYSEEFRGSHGESHDFVKRDTVSASTNRYEFFSGKSFTQFLDEPQASNFTVKELFVHSNDSPLKTEVSDDSGFLSERKFIPENCEGEGVIAEIPDNSTGRVEKLKAMPSVEQSDHGKNQVENPNNNILAKKISVAEGFLSEDDFNCSSSDSKSISFMGDGFLSDTDLGTTIDLDTLGSHDEENAGLTEEDLDFGEEKYSENLDVGYEPDDFDEDGDIMEELKKLEESELQNSGMEGKEELSDDSFQGSTNSKTEESAKPSSLSSTALDIEDSNRFDTLWEHQDLIEQLKMELKKVRATGLPTILEDSESPRIMEDLKPWKIDEKFQHGSTTNELPKFYRSYRERMRKFDILNYQKMYAIGFLQSKDPLQSFSSRKNSSPAITCILPQSFRPSRRKKSEPDPMKRFMRELYSDLEMVYVGQLCLSWEFLQWEYEKALKLWESDQYGLRRYNEVAGEFQQFQVLLQRFIENEPFQGPRVENYVRNRCVMRNLLQVPVIREDNAKDKKKFIKREADKDAITSDMLVEILEESIRTIWRFIRADKDASSLTLKGVRETEVELQDPADSELLVEIKADLQKKEKRLRDILRSGSCILKKFQKHKEDGTDHVLYFFSQVDMKLVWRVLNMSRITTDQLAWCRNKINKISFVNRRLHVEPSFLLFPS